MRLKPVEPIKLTMANGQEQGFLLTMGALKRLRLDGERAAPADGIDQCVRLLFVSRYPWQKDNPQTLEEFENELVFDTEVLMAFTEQLQRHSGVNPQKAEEASPETPANQNTIAGLSGQSSSAAPATITMT